jgi:hypothetical protein
MRKLRENKVRKYTKNYGKVIGSKREYGEWLMLKVTSVQRRQAVTWYRDAGYDCENFAKEFGLSLAVACAVVSAWSPRMRWDRNLLVAREHMQGKKHLGMDKSAKRADRVLLHGIDALNTPTGHKTHNFAWNLLGDYDAVTIDSHMIRAAGLEQDSVSSGLMYEELSQAVRRLAKRHGLRNAEMQALIWIAQRKSAN